MFSTSVTILIAFILFVGMIGQFLSSRQRSKRKPEPVCAVSQEFDLHATPPEPYRPFKAGAYHLTMGLMKATYQDWLVLDNDYHKYTEYRKKTQKIHWDDTNLIAQPENRTTSAAVGELYERIFGYLCRKYPRYFQEDGDTIHNLLRNAKLPRFSKGISSKQLLAFISENTMDDFLLLEFDQEQGEYVLKAMTGSFPSQFNSHEKINKTLTDIHSPNVPQYETKLKRSMNKYFERVQFPHIVKRLNWSVQPQGCELFYPSQYGQSHLDHEPKELSIEDLDFNNEVFLRVERQMLSRLPDSGFICFTVRTLLTQMKQLKEEGLGETFIAAVDGVSEPMASYKEIPVWGEAVKQYLSS